jgi:hypothetical protein
VIKFTLDTKDYGLLIKPKEPEGPNWDLVIYTDSDYAGDKVKKPKNSISSCF